MDRNGDGVITQQEFVQAAAPMSYQAAQPAVQYAAAAAQVQTYSAPMAVQQQSYAAPQMQYAQAAAPISYAAPQPQYMQGQPQSGFEMMDRNGDGVVTRQEFAQAAQPAVQYAAAAQVQTYAAPMVRLSRNTCKHSPRVASR